MLDMLIVYYTLYGIGEPQLSFFMKIADESGGLPEQKQPKSRLDFELFTRLCLRGVIIY